MMQRPVMVADPAAWIAQDDAQAGAQDDGTGHDEPGPDGPVLFVIGRVVSLLAEATRSTPLPASVLHPAAREAARA